MKKLVVLLAIILPIWSFAHVGHGVAESNSLLHLLVSHGVLAGLIIVAIVVSYFVFKKAIKK